MCLLSSHFSFGLLLHAQALESEIIAHEPLIEAVATSAQQMVREHHFAANDIEGRLDHLHKNLSDLKKKTSERKIKLRDALEAQKVSWSHFCCFVFYVQYSFQKG